MVDMQIYLKRLVIEFIGLILVGTILLYALGGTMFIFGWLWGAIMNIIYFSLLSLQIRKAANMPFKKAKRYMRTTFLFRLCIVAFSLLIALLVPMINIISTGFGLLGLKILLPIDHFLFGRKDPTL